MIATTNVTYHVPTSVGTLLLEAGELAPVVNRDEQLPDEQQYKTDEDDAADHSEDDCEHIHWLCTPCVRTRQMTTYAISTPSLRNNLQISDVVLSFKT